MTHPAPFTRPARGDLYTLAIEAQLVSNSWPGDPDRDAAAIDAATAYHEAERRRFERFLA